MAHLLRRRDFRRLHARFRPYSVPRCPLNGHQVSFCRGLCTSSALGRGLCGRLAPHGLIGRTQAAIAAHERRRRAADAEAKLPSSIEVAYPASE